MIRTTILMTSIIAITLVFLVTSENAYAVSEFYWSETTSWVAPGTGGEVYKADAATKTITQLTSGGFARIDDVEIDPIANQIYWNNWASGSFNSGPTEGIYRSNLDGSGQIQVTNVTQSSSSATGAAGHHGIALDPVSQVIYFTRGVSYAGPHETAKVNMDGTSYQSLDTSGWFTSGIALDSTTNTLYWGSPGILNTITGGAVNKINVTDGVVVNNLVPHTNGHGRSLALDENNGLLFYSSFTTSGPCCGGGIGPNSGGGIWVYNVTSGISTNVLPVSSTTGIPDVELDVANLKIYWTEFANGQIQSADYDLNGNLSNISTEISGLTNPYGLALILNEAPDCSNAVASTELLWPPNHKMVDIGIQGLVDADGDTISITVDSITQDEALNAKGKGDGNTSPDGAGVGTDTAQVRAERSGTGDGRVYEISFTADDGNGGFCSSSVTVGVPHDKKDSPVDSGQTVDSTGS